MLIILGSRQYQSESERLKVWAKVTWDGWGSAAEKLNLNTSGKIFKKVLNKKVPNKKTEIPGKKEQAQARVELCDLRTKQKRSWVSEEKAEGVVRGHLRSCPS